MQWKTSFDLLSISIDHASRLLDSHSYSDLRTKGISRPKAVRLRSFSLAIVIKKPSFSTFGPTENSEFPKILADIQVPGDLT